MSSKNQKIDHIGIAVHSIEEALPFYKNVIGVEHQLIEEIESQQVRVAMLAVGEINIELLEPTDPASPIARFLEKNGEGIHHIAFATEDIVGKLQQAKESGVRLLHEVPFQGAHEKLVAFLHPKSCHGILTEFCQDVESKN
ncbi:MAG: methylmalonyl-CoA epimerase [Opitutaceae bacterium]